jgi:N-acylneuraminate cytidylyltransferase
MSKSVAIITARGGSKRIPRKNIKEFCGQPIIKYSIDAAINSGVFEEVMVTTDDLEIAQIAKDFGAKVPFLRSEKTSNDYATTADVIEEVIQGYQHLGKKFDYACCIYPTAPFITAQKFKSAYDLIIRSEADSVVPVVKFSFPIQRGLKMKNNKLEFIWPENALKRSQDLELAYHDSGQFYLLNVNSFTEQKTVFMKNTAGLELPECEVQDIDTEEDWKLAEMKYKLLISNK